MAHYTHGCRSPNVHTATPDTEAREFNHRAIDLNRPPLDDHDPNSSVYDCKSVVSADQSGTPPLLFNGGMLVELSEGHKVHRLIKEDFSRLGALGMQVTLVAIHRNCCYDVSAKARYQAFQVYTQAVQKKGGHNTANVNWAWYTASKEELSQILSYGFGYSGKPENNGLYGSGVYFAPYGYPLDSLISSPIDEDGLRHLLLCRVILGKSELISHGSEQSHPSSEEYDSGVDDLSFPTRYIIRSSHMNTRVLPVYIVSFGAPCYLRGFLKTSEKPQKLGTPSTSVSILIWELSKILPPSHVNLISKYHTTHKERKIPRHKLIQKFREIARDWLLIEIIKSVRTKEREIPTHELIPKIRKVIGDRLLIEIFKSFTTKERKIPRRELIREFRQVGGDRVVIGIIKSLKTDRII